MSFETWDTKKVIPGAEKQGTRKEGQAGLRPDKKRMPIIPENTLVARVTIVIDYNVSKLKQANEKWGRLRSLGMSSGEMIEREHAEEIQRYKGKIIEEIMQVLPALKSWKKQIEDWNEKAEAIGGIPESDGVAGSEMSYFKRRYESIAAGAKLVGMDIKLED